MTPTSNMVHVSRPLTNVSIAYQQSAAAFIAMKAAPVIPVGKQTDQYYVYNRADFNRNEMKLRPRASEAAIGGFTLSTDSYNCGVWALKIPVPWQDLANADQPINLYVDGAEYLANQSLVNMEKVFATRFMRTGVWAQDVVGVSGSPVANQVRFWDDGASTPFRDVAAAMTAMQIRSGGFRPNVGILGRQVADALRNNAEVIDRVKVVAQSSDRIIKLSDAELASAFDLDRLLIMDAVENTAAEGNPETNVLMGGKNMLLAYVNPTPGLKQPSAMYTYAWTGLANNNMGVGTTSYTDEPKACDWVETQQAFDMKVTGADLGYFFSNVVS